MTDLLNGNFESRAWRVAHATVEAAQYIALHQTKAAFSYRQGYIISYRFDEKRPNKYVFVCEPEPVSLEWPGSTTGTNMMAVKRA